MTTALTEARAIQLANEYAAQPPPQQEQKRRDVVAAAVLWWLSSGGPGLTGLIAPLMPGIIADGWLIGAASAQAMTDGMPVATGTWKPGGTQAATSQVASLGLGAQLAAATAKAGQAAQQAADGLLAALGRVLADGAAAGHAAADTGKALLAVLADTARHVAAALRLLVDAIGAAAGCWYREKKVAYVRWLTEDAQACPTCLANEAQGPVPLGTPFSSGDTDIPAHPGCRCAVVPSSPP